MPKLKLTVTVSPKLLRWVDEEVEKGHFASRSHAVHFALMKLQELMEKGEVKF